MKRFKNEQFKLVIEQDECPFDPRGNDNLTKMVCFHRNYNLGDKHDYKQSNYSNWDELKADIMRNEKPAVIKPIRMYDHSGIGISTDANSYPYNCPWDSMWIGFLFITKETMRKEYDIKNVTNKWVEKADIMLELEVAEYNQYLSGDVYHFQLENLITGETDSCSNFYGYNDFWNNGMVDHIGEEAVNSLRTLLEAEFGAEPIPVVDMDKVGQAIDKLF